MRTQSMGSGGNEEIGPVEDVLLGGGWNSWRRRLTWLRGGALQDDTEGQFVCAYFLLI